MSAMSHLEELRAVIRRLHGADAQHIESVPVKEAFQGKTVWEGVVEVFDLIGHATASKVYAWSHDTDGPGRPRRHVTVLHSSSDHLSTRGRARGHRAGVQDS